MKIHIIEKATNKVKMKAKIIAKIYNQFIYIYVHGYFSMFLNICIYWSSENVGTIDILTKYQHLKCCIIISKL